MNVPPALIDTVPFNTCELNLAALVIALIDVVAVVVFETKPYAVVVFCPGIVPPLYAAIPVYPMLFIVAVPPNPS
jgi:hypothetical protein